MHGQTRSNADLRERLRALGLQEAEVEAILEGRTAPSSVSPHHAIDPSAGQFALETAQTAPTGVAQREAAGPRLALFLHGWGTKPEGVKSACMREYLGSAFEVHTFNCHGSGYAHTVTSTVITALERYMECTRPGPAHKWCIVGSSHGGYIAALVASRRPALVDKLFLLAPGFDPLGSWVGEMQQAHASWGTTDAECPGDGFNNTDDGTGGLRWDFVKDLRQHPAYPHVRGVPTVLVHGLDDAEVDPRLSMEWVSINKDTVVAAHFIGSPSPDEPIDHGLYHFVKQGARTEPTFRTSLQTHWLE